MEELLGRAQALRESLQAWRRHLHQHPELSFQETATAGFIAETLAGLGLRARQGVGRTGVVAEIGQGAPIVALRADMDALPIQEENDAPYASIVPGVMHACGHDVHMAWLLGAAALLVETPPPRGRVRLLFQPSEENRDAEGKSGAWRMIEDGAMAGVEAVFGLHVDASVPLGLLRTRAGPFLAAVDPFRATVRGVATHGSRPHQGIDPIAISAQVLNALYAIPSRRISPLAPCVVTVGTIHGGTANNVIPSTVEMTGTIRSFSAEVRQALLQEVRRAFALAEALGGAYDLRIEAGYPVVENDTTLVALLREAAGEVLGPAGVQEGEMDLVSEDFAFLAGAATRGGAFAWLGGEIAGDQRAHHHPRFDVDERVLPLGAAILAGVAAQYLSPPPAGEGRGGRRRRGGEGRGPSFRPTAPARSSSAGTRSAIWSGRSPAGPRARPGRRSCSGCP